MEWVHEFVSFLCVSETKLPHINHLGKDGIHLAHPREASCKVLWLCAWVEHHGNKKLWQRSFLTSLWKGSDPREGRSEQGPGRSYPQDLPPVIIHFNQAGFNS